MQPINPEQPAQSAAHHGLHACHHCDLLVDLSDLGDHRKACCPRCNALLSRHKPDSLNRTLALSLTGLMLYLPAVALPVMSITLLGQAKASTLIGGVVQLAQSGYWWMAFMVAFGSLIVPLCLLLLLFGIGLLSHQRWLPRVQIALLKAHHHLKHWGMLDVYMLSLLVAIIKLRELGSLQMGTGLWAFIALLVLITFAQLQFDSHRCWTRLEARRR